MAQWQQHSYISSFPQQISSEPHKNCLWGLKEEGYDVFTRLPNSNTNLMEYDGICEKQAQSTKTPPRNLQGPNYC